MNFDELRDLLLQESYSEFQRALRESSEFDLETRDEIGRTLLFICAQNGLSDGTHLLLTLGANIEAPNDSGFTPLQTAAENGNYACAKILVESGANVNNVEQSWATVPLLNAVFWGYADVVQLLLDAHSDVTACAAFDYSALGLASLKGYHDIVQLLLRHGGSDLEARNTNGATPLLLAAGASHSDIVDVLLENGASVDAADNLGATLMHVLAQTEQAARIRAIAGKYKPNLAAKDEDGFTIPVFRPATEG